MDKRESARWRIESRRKEENVDRQGQRSSTVVGAYGGPDAEPVRSNLLERRQRQWQQIQRGYRGKETLACQWRVERDKRYSSGTPDSAYNSRILKYTPGIIIAAPP